jgi:predicted GIY-YIG superfamily endonuclease
MNTDKKWLIYWIHLPCHVDFMTEGYVGYTVNYGRRMNDHRRDLTARIGHAWDTLKVTILAELDSLQEARKYERFLRDDPFIGWNKARGGGGGAPHNEESRARLSAIGMGNTNARGSKRTDEEKAHISALKKGHLYNLGKHHTDETKAKISAKVSGSNHGKFQGAMIGADINTGEILHRFEGNKEAAAVGFCSSTIGKVIRCKPGYNHHKGFTWTREVLTN